jgi:hypothetical protein
MKNKKIHIQGKEIAITTSKIGDEYISLTDMAKYIDSIEPRIVVQNWLRMRYTLEFMGHWEILYNSNFNRIAFDAVKNKSGSNSFSISPEKWINTTGAIGIRSSPGRYGGTFAHKDIAFEFATWISPEFKLYLIKEFQRLKQEEHERLSLDWSAKRMLTKINYKIHTDSIKENILIPQEISGNIANFIYASEADVLNMALFGMTAKDWKISNPDIEGNMRDYADVYQLVCLSNLESLNAEFVRIGMTQSERLLQLNQAAIVQMRSLQGNGLIQRLEDERSGKNSK